MQVAGGAVKGFKGDEQAKRCLERLQRVAKAGPRYFLPSHDEIEAIRVSLLHEFLSLIFNVSFLSTSTMNLYYIVSRKNNSMNFVFMYMFENRVRQPCPWICIYPTDLIR